jgi:bacteriocin-like protein
MPQQAKLQNATAPKNETIRASSESKELSKTELDRITGGIKKLPGRWKAGEVT